MLIVMIILIMVLLALGLHDLPADRHACAGLALVLV